MKVGRYKRIVSKKILKYYLLNHYILISIKIHKNRSTPNELIRELVDYGY